MEATVANVKAAVGQMCENCQQIGVETATGPEICIHEQKVRHIRINYAASRCRPLANDVHANRLVIDSVRHFVSLSVRKSDSQAARDSVGQLAFHSLSKSASQSAEVCLVTECSLRKITIPSYSYSSHHQQIPCKQLSNIERQQLLFLYCILHR